MSSSLFMSFIVSVLLIKGSSASAICSATGDPHYRTFDNKRYNFMGRCTYVMAKAVDSSFVVLQVNEACNGRAPSCTKSLTLIMGKKLVKLERNAQVSIAGKWSSSDSFDIQTRGRKVTVTVNGLTLEYNGLYNVFLKLEDKYRGKTLGLCGNFNGNPNDDFKTRSNALTNDAREFGDSWKISNSCPDAPSPGPDPCENNYELAGFAREQCKLLRQSPFTKCSHVINPERTIKNCLYDVCSCKGSPVSCLCEEYAAYAEECQLLGVPIKWRNLSDFEACNLNP